MTNPRIFSSRPAMLDGFTRSIETPSGHTAYVTVNYHEGFPIEVFVRIGRGGSDERAEAEAIGRLCSVALQHGTPLQALTSQLRGISSETTMGFGPSKILSMPDAVARILETAL